jgi:hypothetical protein
MSSKKVVLPLEGGCQCGSVRYAISAAPLTLYCCHCTECQAQSSSAFGMSMLVDYDSLKVDWSGLGVWGRKTDSGGSMTCHFCSTCGTRLFHLREGDTEIVSVKAGSLDDHAWLEPVGHIWTDSAQSWFELSDDAMTTARDPGEMTDYIVRWREKTADWFV